MLKTLIGLGITAGLANRESFVKEVSAIIQEYQQNPEKAEKWAKGLTEYLETVRGNINMQNNIENAVSNSSLPNKEQVDKLTDAIEELTKALAQKDKK